MAKLYALDGSSKGEVKLPSVFSTLVRKDLINRAALALMSQRRQAYGTDPVAGLRTSAHYKGVKDKRGSMKNREIARATRITGGNPGMEWKARKAPHTTKGRRAHPPKAEKIWAQKINRKEMKLAIASAIAATSDKLAIGREIPIDLPVIVDDAIEGVTKTSDMSKFLMLMKLGGEMERAKLKKIRAGRGKMRGRKYKKKRSILFVAVKADGLRRAVENLPGMDVTTVKDMDILMLAPNMTGGRLAIFTKGALDELAKMYK